MSLPTPTNTFTRPTATIITSPSLTNNLSLRLNSNPDPEKMSSSPATTHFPLNVVPHAPQDPLFSLMADFKADTFEKKVDLGIGAYRDDNAKPWVLPVVKKVS